MTNQKDVKEEVFRPNTLERKSNDWDQKKRQ